MEETRRLFDEDSHKTTFDAIVTACEKAGDYFEIILDQTGFFPEEGGQTCDKGTLNGLEVLYVKEKSRIVYHRMAEEIPPGTAVSGEINWEKRFSDMQQHTGEHIVSGLVHRHFDLDNVGFHLGSECVTMDFNGMLTREQLRTIEYEANEAVVRNLPVKVTFPDDETLSDLAYRSKKELEGQIRIVEIEGYDICACCAPHVYQTGEIGLIKLIGWQKYKGGIRVEMLCGFRALKDYNMRQDNISEISSEISVKPEAAAEGVKRLKAENAQLKFELTGIKSAMTAQRLSQVAEGSKNVMLFDEYFDKISTRRSVNALLEKCDGICGCFSGKDENGYMYVIGSKTEDVRETGKKLNAEFNGRGGGAKEMIQGSIIGKRTEIEDFIKKLLQE